MMSNRTKSNWFPAALAIASASVVSQTVDAATGGSDSFPVKEKSAWTVPPPTIAPVIAHGNNGAPPPRSDIVDAFVAHARGLVPEGNLIDDLIKPGPDWNRFGSFEPDALRGLPGSLPSTGFGGPSFFDPHVGRGPIGQPMGAAIPSPGTLALLGLSALALARRRRRT